MKYDYLIVGAGLYGATYAYCAVKKGKRCLVIDKRSHLGGNLYGKEVEGINVHVYGAHIFHTSDRDVWNFVNSLVPFNRYTNCPVASAPNGRLYNLPFNMNTFYQLWGVTNPAEAQAKLDEQRHEATELMLKKGISQPRNLEEQALCLIGKDIYELLIKHYTEKQWGRHGVETTIGLDFALFKNNWREIADKLVYTGPIDEYFDFRLGRLEWRTVRFDMETLDIPNFQGNAVVNYTDAQTPWTRMIEHKHFESFGQDIYANPRTVISREYSTEYRSGMEPYYPVNDERNNEIAEAYRRLAAQENDVIFGGRLAEYKYYDMAPIIANVLKQWIK